MLLRPNVGPARALLLGWIASAVIGCEGEAGADRALRRDSAGVEIIESTAGEWADDDGWRLSAQPVLRIGVADGDSLLQFHEVRNGTLLEDGGIVIANSGTNEVRFYTSGGEFETEVGRTGSGPGEFQSLGPLTRIQGDSVAAYDYQLRRTTILSPVGTQVRDVALDVLQTPVPLGRPFRLDDGSWISGGAGFSSQQLGSERETGLVRADAPIFRINPDASRADTIGMFPGLEIAMIASGRGFMFGPPPFARNLHYFVHREEIYIGTAERLEITVLAPDGRLRRILRGPDLDLTITPERIEAYQQAMLELAVARGFDPAATEARFEDEIYPPSRAAYVAMFVDDEGNVWLGEGGAGAFEPPPQWMIFAADGRYLGEVPVPAGFRVLDVRDGRVLGVATDELDVEYLHVYRLERRDAA